MIRNTESGVIFSTLTQWQVKKGLFRTELAVFRGIFQFHLQCFGVVCKSGRQVYRDLPPLGVGVIVCILNTCRPTRVFAFYIVC